MKMTQQVFIDIVAKMAQEFSREVTIARKASDVMQTDIRTLTLDDTVKTCINVMKAKRIRHIVVIDPPREGEVRPFFVGVISHRDIQRLKPPDGKTANKDGFYPRALQQLLGQVVTRNPCTVEPDAPITDVIRLMLTRHIDMVPVIRNEYIIGIITTTDIIRRVVKLGDAIEELLGVLKKSPATTDPAPIRSAAARTIRDIMTTDIICLTGDNRIVDAIENFREYKIRHIAVTDESGRLEGIISDCDILRQLSYAGQRSPKASEDFRADLFRTSPGTKCLNLTMQQIMTSTLKHVPPDSSVFDGARIILRLRVGCLPVVDTDRKLCGIATIADFMKMMLGFYDANNLSQES